MKTIRKFLQKNLQASQQPDKALQVLKNRYAHYEALVGARCASTPAKVVRRRVIHPDRLRAAGL